MTTKYTITEALSDVKTCLARIAKKRESILRYFSRSAQLKDPLEADGGSKQYIERERQAIKDLENRIVKIRSAIQQVNSQTVLHIGGTSRTVSEWLNWRREVSTPAKNFLTQMANHITALRNNAVRQGLAVTDKESSSPSEVMININERALSQELEEMEGVLGVLDGKLSLLNATTTVEV